MNEVRLNGRQWLIALGILVLVVLAVPPLWERLEKFDTGADYRLPYALSKDYWLYDRRMREVSGPGHVVVLGDSVVWGEYVAPDGTLPHFLNEQSGTPGRFVNGGINGLFPLAEEGLVEHHARSLRGKKVLVQFNLLWLTSPKADLSADKEERFNHVRLVPQFFPRIPCYRADANDRISIALGERVNFLAWVNHLQSAYFGEQSILQWTLKDDGGTPPHYPNAWKNPFAQITFRVPSAPLEDPQRGRQSARHKPWSETGQGTTQFEWVDLDASWQWQAFQRLIEQLRQRGNDVLVVIGPFNEHLLEPGNRPAHRKLVAGAAAWLQQNKIPHVEPEILPSMLYADASHPLTAGYELLAKRLNADKTFRDWSQSLVTAR